MTNPKKPEKISSNLEDDDDDDENESGPPAPKEEVKPVRHKINFKINPDEETPEEMAKQLIEEGLMARQDKEQLVYIIDNALKLAKKTVDAAEETASAAASDDGKVNGAGAPVDLPVGAGAAGAGSGAAVGAAVGAAAAGARGCGGGGGAPGAEVAKT